MPKLLILLTLPKEVRDTYAARIAARFPELEINAVDHFSKALPFMPTTDVLISFGPMLKDEVFRDSQKLKWVQALGTGVDGVIDQPSLRQTPAGRAGKVLSFDTMLLLGFGPRTPQAARQLAAALHPELAAAP